MRTSSGVLVGGALLLLAGGIAAETSPSSAPTTVGSGSGSGSAPFVLGVEGGMGWASLDTMHDFGPPDDPFSGDPSASDTMLSASAGVIGLYAPFRFWSFGPRLSGARLGFASSTSDGASAVEAGVLSIFHIRSDPVRPRVLLGAMWSWQTLPALRSFAIEHNVSPASDLCPHLGVGLETILESSAPGPLSLDLRYSSCWFEHEHSMFDSRTQERTVESLGVYRTSVLLVLGFGWFFGGAQRAPING